jgi:hypothetical protein
MDIVKFGKYLLSKERKKRVLESFKGLGLTTNEIVSEVYHADIENYKK